MAFVIKTIKDGVYCFLFMPALMLVAIILNRAGTLDGSTIIPPALDWFIAWRTSADLINLPLFMVLFLCMLSFVLIGTFDMKRYEKIRITKAFTLLIPVVSKMFMFWAGLFFSWSFGSRLLEFVPSIPGQEVGVLMCICLSVVIRWMSWHARFVLVKY